MGKKHDDIIMSLGKEKISEICQFTFTNKYKYVCEKIVHEHPIIVGKEGFRKEIGYLDLKADVKRTNKEDPSDWETFTLIIDAKPIQEFDDTGKIIRQMKKYKAFLDIGEEKWMIYTDEKPPQNKVDYIQNNNIYCLWDEKLKKEGEGDAK